MIHLPLMLFFFPLLWNSGCNVSAGILENTDWISVFSKMSKSQISASCHQSLNLTKTELFKYVDASGKPGAGILTGNTIWLGNYDQCMNLKGAHYCSMKNIVVHYQNQNFTMAIRLKYGLCIPKECNVQDASNLIKELTQKLPFPMINITVMPVGEGTYGPNAICFENGKNYSNGAITMLVISGIIASLCLIGTAIDIFLMDTREDDETETLVTVKKELSNNTYNQFEEKHQNGRGDISMHAVHVFNTSNKLVQFFMCFSLVKNTRTMFDTTVPPGAITCLNGIRTISIMWVIMGHYLIFMLESAVSNTMTSLEWVDRFSIQPLLNGGFAVDTFFTLSGTLVAYLSLKRFDQHGKLPLVRYYVHRYIRLTPSYAYVIFFLTYIYPLLYDGPNWTGSQSQNCKDYWWTNLLYINNFYPDSIMKVCLSVSWYLGNDMQFYVISPIILWFMYRYNWNGIGAIAALITILHFLTNGILIHEKNATPLFYEKGAVSSIGGESPLFNYQNYVYTKPYCRVAVYFIGLVLGYVIYHKYMSSKLTRFNNVFHISGWAISISLMFVLLYAPYTSTKHTWSDAENIGYGVLFRILWGFCIAWMVYACHNKQGGLINDFLSWRAFIPLSRLTYGVYLFHILIIFLYLDSQRVPMFLSEITFSINYIAVTVVSFICSYFLSVCIEYPVFNLEKLFLKF